MTTAIETPSALMEWTQRIETLVHSPNTAYEAMSQIHTSFGELLMRYSEAGDLDMAELVTSSYNHALMIYEQGQKYEAALVAGQAAINALDEQRLATLGELSGLLDAIKRGSEAHPILMNYAETIRADERESTLDSDDVWMIADEGLVDDVLRTLTGDYGLPFSAAKTLLNMISGAQFMTEQQRDAFDAFWPTIDPDRKDR